MGMTEVRVRVVNLVDASRFAEVDLVVDSGAIYSVVPAGVLRRIGVEPGEVQAFGLAHGESVRRSVGDVRYEVGDRSGAARFGPPRRRIPPGRGDARGARAPTRSAQAAAASITAHDRVRRSTCRK